MFNKGKVLPHEIFVINYIEILINIRIAALQKPSIQLSKNGNVICVNVEKNSHLNFFNSCILQRGNTHAIAINLAVSN